MDIGYNHNSIEYRDTTDLECSESSDYITSGSSNDLGPYLYNLPNNLNILRNADIRSDPSRDSKLQEKVEEFVVIFQRTLLKNRNLIKRNIELPPLDFKWLEDNSVLVEWIFKDFRIGFLIESQDNESGWYFVSNKNLNEVNASGDIDFKNLESLLVQLLNLAVSYS